MQPAPMIEPGAPVVKIVRRSVSSPPGIGPGRLMQPLVAPLPTAALKYGFDVDGTADELLFAGTPPGAPLPALRVCTVASVGEVPVPGPFTLPVTDVPPAAPLAVGAIWPLAKMSRSEIA